MSDPTLIQVSNDPTVEDIMAALAKESIFDLPALTKQMVTVAQEKAGAEDTKGSAFIHKGVYILYHED